MTSLASVFVEVRPDTSHFSTELKSSLAKTREAVDVAATLDTAKLKPQLDRLKADLKSITVTKANITADSAKASAQIKALRTELRGLSENVKINADDSQAQERIAEIKTELATLGDARSKLSVDSSLASAHVKALQAQLQVFDGTTATADVKVRGTDGVNFAFRGVSNLTTAIVGLAPVAVPALAAVTAGVGVLGGVLLAAGGAAGIWGGVLAGALTKYQKDVETLKSLGKQLASATDPAKAAAIKQQMDAITAQWSPAEKKFDRLREKFGQAFQALVKAAGPATFGVLNTGMGGLIALMPRLAPLINSTGRAIGGLVADLVDFTSTRRFQSILDFFLVYGPSAITHFGHIAGNILLGVFNLFAGFAPHGANFLRTFEGMTASFERWSAGFGRSGGFQRFMAYAQRVLPDVRDLFINLAEFAGKFIVALGPLGGIELRVVTLFLEGLNNLPPRALTGIAFGITGIVLGLKAWELGVKAVTVWNGLAAAASAAWTGAQWLLNAALAANPLGLFIIGIAAVAAGLVLAYKKSETFRNIVNGAMNAVKDAAQAVTRWFSRSFIPFFTDTIPAAFRATLNWVRRNWPVLLAILTGPVGLATLFIVRHWDQITRAFRAARDWVVGAFRRSWAAVSGVLSDAVQRGRVAIGNNIDRVRAILGAIRDFATGAFRRAWAGLRVIFTDPVQAARNVFQNLLGPGGVVRRIFSNAVDGIARIWSNLRAAVRAPIAFIVNTVFNRGIVPFVNRIPFIPGTMHTIGGFDTGGYTGHGGKYEPAGIVHRNEHVIRSESTESVNRAAPGFLDHLNQHGAAALRGVLPGYWIGGGVKPAAGAVSQHSGYPWAQWSGDINEPGSSDIGHPVHAWKSGVVAMVKHLTTSYGNHIRLNHAGNERTLYAHLSRVLVNVGQRVAQNQVIGLKGGTGNVTGPHLHFELSGGSNRIDFGGQFGRSAAASAYTGPTAGDARTSLDPAGWVRTLRGMGSWGGALGGMVSGIVGNLRDTVVNKIKAAVKTAGDFLLTGGTGQFTANSRGVWKALRSSGWNQAAAAGIMGNIQYESGFSPTIIQGGSHGSPEEAGSRGYGLVQWTPATKIARMLHGRPPTVGNEIAALTGELRGGYGGLVHQLQSAKSPVVAAMAFLHGFERPANPNQPQRGLAATAWFNRFARKGGAFDDGGLARGRGVILKGTAAPERVLSPRQTDTFDRLLPILERMERGTGTGPVRIVLDAGGGVTLTGHIDNRIQGRRAQAATVGRQYR